LAVLVTVVKAKIRCGGQLLRKEKDEASPHVCAWWGSLNAFILDLPGVKAFCFLPRAGLRLKRN